jgi:hypothetical protein
VIHCSLSSAAGPNSQFTHKRTMRVGIPKEELAGPKSQSHTKASRVASLLRPLLNVFGWPASLSESSEIAALHSRSFLEWRVTFLRGEVG